MSPWGTDADPSLCVIKINGIEHEVEHSDSFKSTVLALAAGKGLAKFTVYVDGAEVDERNPPATFEGMALVEIKKYDEAA